MRSKNTPNTEPPVARCSITGTPNNGCLEYSHAAAGVLDVAAQMCNDTSHGEWAEAACPHTASLGGCSNSVSTPQGKYTMITWFYPGERLHTASDAMTECQHLEGTYVAP